MTFRQHETNGTATVQERFTALARREWSALARYCNSVAGDKDDARDLMSETLLRAYEHFASLREPDAFRAYLFRIAIRVQQEWSKKRRRQTPMTDELRERIEVQLADDGLAAERSLAVQELYEALATLPDKQREAITLFEISGLSLKEIQEIQGGSLSGVKSRIVRAREDLVRKLGARNEEHSFERANAPQIPSQNLRTSLALSGKAIL